MNREKNNWLRGLNIFFSAIGVVTVICTIALLATSGPGLATLFSVIGLIKPSHCTRSIRHACLKVPGLVSLMPWMIRIPGISTNKPIRISRSSWKPSSAVSGFMGQDNRARIMIYSPIKGTPAYKEGIRHGDIIVRINGQSTMKMTSDEAVQLMRGDPGTKLELGVYRDSEGKELNFTIVREIINVPSVEDQILDEAAGIGYISLNQFHAQSQ